MKKLVTIFIVSALLISVFTGCQQVEKQESESEQVTSSSAPSTSSYTSTSSETEKRDIKTRAKKIFPDAEIISEANDITLTVDYDGTDAEGLIKNCTDLYMYWGICDVSDGDKLNITVGEFGTITGLASKEANAFGYETNGTSLTDQSLRDEYEKQFILTDVTQKKNMEDLEGQRQDVIDEINDILDKHN